MSIRHNSKPLLTKKSRFRPVLYYAGHICLYLGLLIIALVMVWLVIKANRIYTSYKNITQTVSALEETVRSDQVEFADLNMVQVEESIRSVASETENIYQELMPFFPLTPYLGWVPVYGADIQAMPYLLSVGRDAGRVAVVLMDTLSPVLNVDDENAQSDLLPKIVDVLAQVKGNLAQAELLLQYHETMLNQLEVEGFSPQMARRTAQLQEYLPQITSALQSFQSLPVLLGADSPQTYLVLTQNSGELRPSGGYINAAGHVIIERGKIVEFVMQDSYAIDQLSEEYPYPPTPLYEYMASDYWVLRDAGWSPDFPTAVRTIMDLYELGQGVSAEGVIMLDQHALAYLLRGLGPVEVEGEQVTGDNVITLMRRHWEPEIGEDFDSEWWLQRKSFMLSLAEPLRQRIEQDLRIVDLPVLISALAQALDEKHMLIYLEDPAWNTILTERKWNASLLPTQGDYLMVVDANVGFNKANELVEQRLDYQVTLADDGSAEAHAQLRYQHNAPMHLDDCSKKTRNDPTYEQNMERCYWNYQRLVVPAGAQLNSGPQNIVDGQYLLRGQSTTGEIDIEPLSPDKVSWGQLFLLRPQDSITLDYIYTLPIIAHQVGDRWEYTLYLQKQPGTLAPPINVSVTLPLGAQLLNSQPLPSSQEAGTTNYQFNLITDQEINITYKLPE